ncbi:MAG: ThiF family adenylyltransferase, partial [Verrucomicrobia bacterium]|nr:ThiF family adenylyltransferase [Verrucomicrobiota bacterium]
SGLRRINRFNAEESLAKRTLSPPLSEVNELDVERLDRNLRFLGEQGQRRITATTLAVCGLGGAGTELLKNCRGLGFQHYILIDMDRVESSNLNRLIWSRNDVGRYKTEVALEFVHAVDPQADVTALTVPVSHPRAQEALLKADFIVNALDNDAARLEVQIIAARHLKPLLDLGSGITLCPGTQQIASMGGQVSFYVPGGPCLLCQGLDPRSILSPEHRAQRRSLGYVEGTNETPPSVVTVNAVIAGIASDILMKYVTGFSAVPTWIRYDLLRHTTAQLHFTRRFDCPICGAEGVEGLGADGEQPLLPPHTYAERAFFEPPSISVTPASEMPGNPAFYIW